jgi:hypothetical protein
VPAQEAVAFVSDGLFQVGEDLDAVGVAGQRARRAFQVGGNLFMRRFFQLVGTATEADDGDFAHVIFQCG